MNSQINVRMSDELLDKVQEQASSYGYNSVQEFIRETIREKVFKDESLSSVELNLVKKLLFAVEKHQDYVGEEELMRTLDS